MRHPNVTAIPAEPVAERRTDRLNRACDDLKSYDNRADTALILGTGLADMAGQVCDAESVAFSDIPGFPVSDVAFHPGRLVFGRWMTDICVLQGRYHLYEGHSFADVVFPVDVLAALGVKQVIMTHAAGGIRPHLHSGTLACLTDQINLTGSLFTDLQGYTGFTDMSAAFDLNLRDCAERAARKTGAMLHPAVLAGITGPALPTEAEIRMYRRMGADIIGMSVVPEVARARQLGMRVLGLTLVTDQSLPGAMQNVTAKDVKQVAEMQRPVLTQLIQHILTEIKAL